MPFSRSVEIEQAVGGVSSALGAGFTVMLGMFVLSCIGGMVVYYLDSR